MKMVFFDTETTGLDSVEDRIIELAFVVVEDGVVVRKYDEFVDVGVSLSDEVVDLTGITDELLSVEGVSERCVADDLMGCLDKGVIMIAHNCQFDLNFIFQLLVRYYSEDVVLDLFGDMFWLDTLTVFKDRKGYPHKLEDMVKYYGIEWGSFHRAIDDTLVLCECVKALNRERNDLVAYFNVFGFNPKWGVSGIEFDFIRYVPQSFSKGMVGKDFILPLL